MTSASIGARTVEQLDNPLDALLRLDLTDNELEKIDVHATEGAIDLWDVSSQMTEVAAPPGPQAAA